MNKNKSFLKTLGIFLCFLSVVVYIVLLLASADVRGHKKLLDKYCTSVQRGNAAGLSEVLANSQETDIDAVLVDLSEDNQAAFGKDSFKSPVLRYRIDESEKLGDSACKLFVTFTLSTEDETFKTQRTLTVQKSGGQWQIAG